MVLLESHPNTPTTWKGELPVTNRYTYGLAGEHFFRSIKDEGIILGSYCSNCQVTYVPASDFCERCLDKLNNWFDVGIVGEIHSYTLLYVNSDGSTKEKPDIIAFIRFGDGGLIHHLGEIEQEDIEFGMDVEAVFKPTAEREGSILDIMYFRPVKSMK
jgi:uncharacterized OB-fold protein